MTSSTAVAKTLLEWGAKPGDIFVWASGGSEDSFSYPGAGQEFKVSSSGSFYGISPCSFQGSTALFYKLEGGFYVRKKKGFAQWASVML